MEYPRQCRNGHVIQGPLDEHWGEHRQCKACRWASQERANDKYYGRGIGPWSDLTTLEGRAESIRTFNNRRRMERYEFERTMRRLGASQERLRARLPEAWQYPLPIERPSSSAAEATIGLV